MSDNIEEIIRRRQTVYGSFATLALIAQQLKAVAFAAPGAADMQPMHKEALELIFTKIARILNGDAACRDSWVDIAGYATLVSDYAQKKESGYER